MHPEERGEDGEHVNKDFIMLFFSDVGLYILREDNNIFVGNVLFYLCSVFEF